MPKNQFVKKYVENNFVKIIRKNSFGTLNPSNSFSKPSSTKLIQHQPLLSPFFHFLTSSGVPLYPSFHPLTRQGPPTSLGVQMYKKHKIYEMHLCHTCTVAGNPGECPHVVRKSPFSCFIAFLSDNFLDLTPSPLPGSPSCVHLTFH